MLRMMNAAILVWAGAVEKREWSNAGVGNLTAPEQVWWAVAWWQAADMFSPGSSSTFNKAQQANDASMGILSTLST